MPRRQRSLPAQPIPSNSLVASAARYKSGDQRLYHHTKEGWQERCYHHYKVCGEARFAARFYGNALSRSTLAVAKSSLKKGDLAKSGPAKEALDALFNGPDGQAQMLYNLGVHLTVAGEAFLIGRTVEGQKIWEVYGRPEVQPGATWYIIRSAPEKNIKLADSDEVIRIWLPMPGNSLEADSPFRALLPILDELEYLSLYVFAQIRSRLMTAGIMWVPDSMTFPPPPNAPEGQPVTGADGLMYLLAQNAEVALADPSSPSAKTPIVISAPSDDLDKPRLMELWSKLDEHAKELRQELIGRFALGMDLPPERVLGAMSGAATGGGNSNGPNHWGMWQVEEDTIKMHIEPMLELVCNAVTIGYLRPASDDDQAVVVASTEKLRLRPDRSKEATELNDRGLVKDSVVLLENGFDPETEMMDEKERGIWLLRKMASGSATPEMVAAAAKQLGVDLPVTTVEETNEARPSPSLEDHPTRPRDPSESALLAASEGLVFRALERAGNRLRNNGTRPPGVRSYETHVYVKTPDTGYALEDAWSCAPELLAGIADHEQVVPVLNDYVTTLLREQSRHQRPRLQQWLSLLKRDAG